MNIQSIYQLITVQVNILRFKNKMLRKTTPSGKTPYCKVCHDSGKSESEYTSHWVKDRDGKTLCPTLLNTECRYCFKLGHTAKFCQVLAKKNVSKERLQRAISKDEKLTPVVKKPVNSFAALECDSDSEEEVIPPSKIPVEEYPALPSNQEQQSSVLQDIKTGWALIAAKPKEEVKPKEEIAFVKATPQLTIKPQASAPKSRNYTAPIYTKSWADWSESDSEEDEEFQVKPWTTVCATQTMSPGWPIAVADDDDW